MNSFQTYLHTAWAPRILIAATLTLTGVAYGQQAPAPDPYQGVSQPPPDDTIVASPEPPPATAVKPSPAIPARSAQPAAASSYIASAPPPSPHAAAAYNPEDDIVSSVPTEGTYPASVTSAGLTAQQSSASNVTLTTRDPDAGIVSAIPSPGNELPEGTNIRVRLTDRLSTTDTTAGSPFRGEVTTAVFKDGRIIIPPGSILKGRVISVHQGHHFAGAATIHLRPDLIILPDGTAYHLYAQVIHSQAPGTRTDSEGGIQPSSHWKKDTLEYGAAAGTGALVGAKIAGPHGALIGAGVGATLVTAHLLMQHPSAAVLPTGSVVTFSLSEPMELTPTRN
jgi:hypothetical protein